jgi:hypothetical protein
MHSHDLQHTKVFCSLSQEFFFSLLSLAIIEQLVSEFGGRDTWKSRSDHDDSRLYMRRWINHAFSMLGLVSHMGFRVDQEPHSQSTVGTAAPAVAAVPPAVAYTLSASL